MKNQKNSTTWIEKSWNTKPIKFKLVPLDNNFMDGITKKCTLNSAKDLITMFDQYRAKYYDDDWKRRIYWTDPWSIPLDRVNIFKKKNSSIANQGQTSERYAFSYPLKLLWDIVRVLYQDNYYILETDDGDVYSVDINEFDEKWISSKSLKPWRPPLSKENNGVYTYIMDADRNWVKIMEGSKIKTTIPWEFVTIIQKDLGKILLVNKNRFEVTTINKDWTYIQENPIAHNYGTIEKIRTDRNENFVFVIGNHGEWWYKMHILNRKTLQEVDSISDIKDIIFIDEKNDINCLSKGGGVIYVDTNFDQFPKWYVDSGDFISENEQVITTIENKPRTELQEALTHNWIKIDFDSISNWESVIDPSNENSGDEELRKEIRDLVIDEEHNKTLKVLYNEADTEQKADILRWVIGKLKSDSKIGAVKWILDPIESAIFKKRSEIKLAIIRKEMKEIVDNLWTSDDLITLIGIQTKLTDLKKRRSQIIIWPGIEDKQLTETIKLVTDKIKEYRDTHKEETLWAIDDSFAKIKEYLDNIDYPSQLTSVYKTDLRITTDNIIKLLWPDDKKTYNEKLNDLFRARQKTLSDLENKKKTDQIQEIWKKIEEIKSDINQLESILNSVETIDMVKSMKKEDPLMMKILWDTETLSDSKKQELRVQLDNIFTQRIFQIKLEQHESKWVIKALDEYGIDTLLYHSNGEVKNIDREITWVRNASWNVRLQINIEDGKYIYDEDRYFDDPDQFADIIIWDTIKFEMSQSEFLKYTKNLKLRKTTGKVQLKSLYAKLGFLSGKEQISENLDKTKEDISKVLDKIRILKKEFYEARYTELFVHQLINKSDINVRPFLAKFDPRFIVLDEEKAVLEELSARLVNQKEEKRWIDILEWWPWLGKTEMCKFIAAVTNREIVRVQCSKMDPADLFFSPQIKKWETTRQAADRIKLMQKPGTMVLLDEIDKLNDDCFARLHSLFDGDRSVYDPQTWKVTANADCLFLWTMNSYDKLSNPIVSRSRIQMIEYPNMQNEAYKITKYTNNEFLEELSYEDFSQLRNKYTVQGASAPKNANERKIYDAIINIKHLLNIITELRKKYDSDSFDDKFEYELSYRDAHDIFVDFNADPAQTFKKSIKDILIPKVRAVVKWKEEKDIQKSITEKVVDAEMK